jgi:two-component system, LuxR family, response regulator FixJ
MLSGRGPLAGMVISHSQASSAGAGSRISSARIDSLITMTPGPPWYLDPAHRLPCEDAAPRNRRCDRGTHCRPARSKRDGRHGVFESSRAHHPGASAYRGKRAPSQPEERRVRRALRTKRSHMAAEPIVHIVDDGAEVRRSLSVLLQSAGIATRSYSSAREFLDVLPQVTTGCVITDVKMPEIDGLELQRRVKARHSLLPVLIITGDADIAMAVAAMKEGAFDFIEKPFNCDEIIRSVKSALDVCSKKIGHRPEAQERRPTVEALSPREREVLAGLLSGKSNKAIAEALEISARTVEVHRANIMAKMDARSLSDLTCISHSAKITRLIGRELSCCRT